MKTKKGDFVELVYVGRLDDGLIFDLNDETIAKKEGLNPAPKTIACLGERDVVVGLDDFLVDKDVGNNYDVVVSAEEGFGKKQAGLIQMIPLRKFRDQEINPMPGLRLNIDGQVGTVKSVSGGRVLVDFNHPLAGRELHYAVTIKRVVDDIKEKVGSFLQMTMQRAVKVDEKDGDVTVHVEVPEELQKMFNEELKKRIPQLKSIKFKK